VGVGVAGVIVGGGVGVTGAAEAVGFCMPIDVSELDGQYELLPSNAAVIVYVPIWSGVHVSA